MSALKAKMQDDGFKKKVAMLGLSLVIMYLGPLVIPTWATITKMGIKMMCVYVGVITVFIATGDIFSGSVLGIIATVIHGYQDLNGMWQTVFGSSTSVQMVAMMCFAYAVQTTGAFDVLGRKIIRASRVFKKRPMLFCVIFMLCMYICLWYIGGLAAVVTIIPLFESIAATAGYKIDEKWHKLMMVILFLCASSGGYTRGTNGMQLGWIGLFENAVTFDYVYKPLELMISSRITLAVLVVLLVIASKVLFRADMSKLAAIDFDNIEMLKEENCKFKGYHIITLIMFLIVIVRSLLSNPFAQGTVAWSIFNTLDMKTLAFVAIIAGSYIRFTNDKGEKQSIINIDKTMGSLPWGIFLVLGTMMVIAGALSNEELGIRPWLVSVLDPLFGTNNYFVFCFMICFFTTFITNLMSNQATIMIMLSIAAPFMNKFVDAGYNVTPLVGMVCVLGNFAIMLYCSGAISPYFVSRKEMAEDQKFVFTKVPVMLLISVIVCAVGATVFGKIM